ncbi:MAG: ROK family transcriptional regulator [Alphaproteobacteria bacterium]|nr:ROK family transcriptional regulator [Alphaproteobacteria bacterium]
MSSASNTETQQDRGSNQASLRAYNERLVLSLVRRQGGLAKADIARATGLSAQTVSVIMRGLERDGLLIRGKPVKGRVGQPSVPMHLAPDGAYAIGLKIGRRSADLALMNFVGEVQQQIHKVYPYPMPEPILDFAEGGIKGLLASLPKARLGRVAGVGIATPFELWNWAEEVGAPRDQMEAWRDVDLAAALGERCPLPMFSQNDATAACGAELILGRGAEHADFVYFFIGSFVGGGIVLNNAVFTGRSGNAGALGSMPMPTTNCRARQLIEEGSIYVLEKQLRAAGIDPSPLWLEPEGWTEFAGHLDAWIDHTSKSLAHAIVASCSVIDFPTAIIDGGFPAHVREAIVAATQVAVTKLDLQGIQPPEILEGSIGGNARVIGGASLPFFARYLVDQSLLFKASA